MFQPYRRIEYAFLEKKRKKKWGSVEFIREKSQGLRSPRVAISIAHTNSCASRPEDTRISVRRCACAHLNVDARPNYQNRLVCVRWYVLEWVILAEVTVIVWSAGQLEKERFNVVLTRGRPGTFTCPPHAVVSHCNMWICIQAWGFFDLSAHKHDTPPPSYPI